MGTSYNINIRDEVHSAIEKDIFNIINAVNLEMSTYLKDSLISKFNSTPINQWFKANEDFVYVLKEAIRICNLSGGIYDVTSGKLVELWGFGSKDAPIKRIDKRIIQANTNQIGCGSVDINKTNSTVRKVKDIKLDFSSIAKGFAVDKVYEFLKENRFNNFLIEIGGEIRVSGFKQNNEPWLIGIIHPEKNDLIYTFYSDKINSLALATSGDYQNTRLIENTDFSHTIDTKTGIPKPVKGQSITVITDNATTADALATMLNAMNPEEAINFSNKNNIMSLVIYKENSEYLIKYSADLLKMVE